MLAADTLVEVEADHTCDFDLSRTVSACSSSTVADFAQFSELRVSGLGITAVLASTRNRAVPYLRLSWRASGWTTSNGSWYLSLSFAAKREGDRRSS